jgi:hypothetical protein
MKNAGQTLMGVIGSRGKTMSKNTTVATWGGPMFSEPHTVIMRQQGRNKFSVQYGKQIKENLDYAAAGAEFGLAVMHAQACEGILDNRMPGER